MCSFLKFYHTKSALVKRLTSNEIILYSSDIFSVLIFLLKISVIKMLYSDFAKGIDSVVRNLTVSCIAVSMLDMISCLCNSKRYVDDTHVSVVPKKVQFILIKLCLFHPNIQFTREIEKPEKILFFDTLIL